MGGHAWPLPLQLKLCKQRRQKWYISALKSSNSTHTALHVHDQIVPIPQGTITNIQSSRPGTSQATTPVRYTQLIMHQQHGRYWCKYHPDYSTEQWRALLQMVQESSTHSLDKVLYMVCIHILLEALEKETLSSHSTGNCFNNWIGCSQTTDCGKCKFCMDKPKFGGAGTLKQRCLERNAKSWYKQR